MLPAPHRSDPASGFTLIELSIVLVILGLLLSFVGPALLRSITKTQQQRGEVDVLTARRELIGFAKVEQSDGTHRLPTPAEFQNFAGSRDVWNNPVFYVAYQGDICEATGTGLNYELHVSNPDATPRIYEEMAFIVVSPGQNKNLQIDETNATGNHTVALYRKGNVVDFFPGDLTRVEDSDDIGEYMSLAALFGEVCAASKLDTDPPGNPLRQFTFDDGTYQQGYSDITPEGDPEVLVSGDAVDGYIIELDGDDAYSVDNGTFALPTYTVMAWFKVRPGDAPLSEVDEFHVITSRQDGGGGGWTQRNWWLTLWGPPGEGGYNGGPTPIGSGQLSFRASTEGSPDYDNFDMTTECPGGVDVAANLGCGHDGEWHHGAVIMQSNTALGFENSNATLIYDGQIVDTVDNDTLVPAHGTATWNLYIGRDHDTDRNFIGYLDDIIIYDDPLDPQDVIDYYNNLKAAGYYP